MATYSFLFTLVALLYLVRDKNEKKLLPFETAAFAAGTVYALYRSVFYAVTKYGLTEFGEGFESFFSNTETTYILSLIVYLLFVIMCFAVMRCYNAKILAEQDEKIKAKKKMLVAPKIYNSNQVGLDTLEDDFLFNTEYE